MCAIRIRLLVATAILSTAGMVMHAQPSPRPTVADGVRLLREGDAFRAILTLNEVIAQKPDTNTLARAHALRAMAYLAQSQPERAKAAVITALAVDAGFTPNPNEVDAATIALFEATRAPAPADPEAAGQVAEAAGQLQQAFLFYVTAYRALPVPAPQEDDRRLRERIIRVVKRLAAAPAIPNDAREHVEKADRLIEAEAILGSTAGASTQAAATELQLAVHSAPWWPEATFKLASVLQKLKRVDDALVNLALYRLADPAGFAASASIVSPTAAAPGRPAAVAPVPSKAATVGKVLVYRPGTSTSMWVRPKLECNGAKMAELQNGRMTEFTVPAGKQVLKLGGDQFEPTLEAGKTYYYRVQPSAFGWTVREATPDEAAAEIKNKKVRHNDVNRTVSSECKPALARPAAR